MAALSLGLLFGFITTVAPSCSAPPRRCNEANCAGCCDSTNQCQQGRAQDACGINGASCAACATGQMCQRVLQDGGVDTSIGGRCITPGGMGGMMMMGAGGSAGNGGVVGAGGGSAGAGGGGMMTDGGCLATQCIDMSGGSARCRNQSQGFCGINSTVCMACPMNQVCSQPTGTCMACNGCVDRFNGQCQPGNTDVACGATGAECTPCRAGESCVNGTCQNMTGGCGACSNGCCSGSTCVPLSQQSSAQCGVPGTQCIGCNGGTCDTMTGSCSGGGMNDGGIVFPGFDGGFNIPQRCNAGMCASGLCCDALGFCQTIGSSLAGQDGGPTYCGPSTGGACTIILCGSGGLLPNCNRMTGTCQP
jgi:hypothetical protein